MSTTVNLNLALDTSNPSHLVAASEFLAAIAGGKREPQWGGYAISENDKPEATEEVKQDTAKKTRAPRGSKVQAGALEGQERTESIVDDYEAKKLEVVQPTDAEDDLMGDSKPTYTQNEVREEMAKKMDNHRAAMKDKITELGAAKFVDMDSSKYPEFMAFLKDLK